MAGQSGYTNSNSLIQMWLTVLLSLLQVIPTYRNLAEAHSSAYVQTTATTKGLREIRLDGANIHSPDGMGLPNGHSLRLNERINGKNVDSIRQPGSGSIIIEPSMLDFGEQPIGMPKIETVTIHNPHPENNIRMLSISGNTPHFHSSFFQDKLVPPGANTTFDVVFLARVVGNAENSLYIHTNKGLYPYQVFGVGIPNPYRLRPFLGARVPVNTSFSPLINMHNPYSQTIQVTEMYSSGGDLHLELPSGEREALQSFWEIPPFQTKSVMRASFVGRIESNHTAFIRIKTNQTEEEEEFVILPVEVEVSSAPGIYSSLEMLDFGTLRSLDEPKTTQIYLINTGQKPVHITSVTLVRTNEAVTIDFKPLVLKPPERHTKVADVSFDPSKAVNSRHWSGKIVIKTKEKNFRLQIPYQAYVLQGTLGYNKNSTMFYIGKPPYEPVVRDLTLTNLFNFALVIYDVTVPEDIKHIFSIEKFSGPIFIAPDESDSSLKVLFNSSASLRLSTVLRLNTNASSFTIPLHCYNGTLQYIVHSAEGNQINFGTMGIGDVRSMTFTIINKNPIAIPLHEWGCNIDGTRVDLLGVEPGNGTYLSRVHNISEIDTDPLVLPPHHYAVFRIEVIGPNQEGQFVSEVLLKSPYEVISIAVIMRTADGCLQAKPEEIRFRPTFPGHVVYQSLTLLSSFKHPMTLEDIKPEKKDPRFYFKSGKKSGTDIELEPMKKNKVGRVFYDAKQLCQDDCYVGLPTSTADGHQWLHSLSLPPDIVDIDTELYQTLRSQWQEIQDTGYAIANITLKLNTNLVKGFNIPAEAQLIWPSLLRKDHIQFPLTQIGNSSIEEVKIYNPSDVPLLVQLLPITSYPNHQTILEVIMDRERFDPDSIDEDGSKTFFLADLHNTSVQSSSVKQRHDVESTFSVKTNTSSIPLLIKSRSNVTVNLGFMPVDEVIRTSLILIRNNLTILDFLLVEGQGARGEFRVSGRKPGANSTLLFELKQSHLQDCDKSSPRARSPPNFTVKRTFTTKNVGQLPIHIKSFEVNGLECEGYGFKVLNCKPYIVKPNQTYKVDIAFTPDFTLSRVTRQLKFITSRGPDMEYTLLATIPPNMLPHCSSAIPRPAWEHLLYAATICLMITLFMGVLMVSYLEALRFHPAATLHRRRVLSDQFDKNRRFDLKTISGIKSNAQDTKSSSGGFMSGIGSTLGLRQNTPSPPQNNHTTMPNNTKLHHDGQQLSEKNVSSESERVRQNSWNGNTRISHVENLGTRSSPNSFTSGNSPPVLKKQNPPKNNKRKLFMEPELEQNTINNTRLLDNEYELQKQNLVENVNLNSCVKTDETANEQTKQQSSFNDLDSSSAKKTKQKQRKSKATLKREDKERMKERLLRKDDLTSYDHDDSSSTTTECSNPDLDTIEKLTKQPVNLKSEYDDDNLGGLYTELTTKQKSKLKKDDILDIGDLKRFENVKVKSKSRKSSKVDPKSIFNGDVLRPSTLELPYTTALEACRRKVKGPTSPHSIAAAVAAKAMKRNIKESNAGLSTFNVKMVDISESGSDKSSDIDKDSPPPLWDQPKPLPNSVTATTTMASVSPGLNGSGRNNSYSSVVSSTGNGDGASKSKKKNKMNKTLGTPGKTSNSAFTAVGEIKHPGAIGTKNKLANKPSWLCNDLDSSDAASGGSSPNSPGGVPLTPNTDPNFNQVRKHAPTFIPLQENEHFTFSDDVAASMWNSKKPDNGSEWLGFGVSSSNTSGSFWDPTHTMSTPQASSPSWNTNTSASKPPLFQGNQLWDTPKPASRDNNLIPSIWTSDSIWTTGSSSNDSSLLDMSTNSPTQKPEVSGAFDPFDSFRSSIWGPSRNQPVSAASLWNTNNQINDDQQ
ncbi:transmembrane protein 131-like isoform X2 [Ptychodera flava]|uniref:transmembrane protein 131-like isoform X2 n=1 Tax=Ptychodera flava TaxID=63121 RepID=UPI003969C573